MRSAGASGGLANEAGGLHRSGVAAVLAAYGLASQGIAAAGDSTNNAFPVSLSFETDDAVDDIRCELSDGSLLLLQAKRACGVDRHMRSTVRQWVIQAPSLGVGDRVGLVARHLKGKVAALGPALRRSGAPYGGAHSSDESEALKALDSCYPSSTPGPVRDRVNAAAVVFELQAETEADAHFIDAAHLLENLIVPAGYGVAAVKALQGAFRERASVGQGAGLDEWLEILDEAHIEIYRNASGPAGARRQAERSALNAHLARLASRKGMMSFGLLADDLPPMYNERLADSFQVSVPGDDATRPREDSYLDTARRWPRMLLVGLPGSGKSTALEQLAASWAEQDLAPVPVLVPLRELALQRPHHHSQVTLDALLEVATASAPTDERVPLRKALEGVVLQGDAVLLFDGLDECRDYAALVADGIFVVLKDVVHKGTGVVLASRESKLKVALRLELPLARLSEPAWLSGAMTLLLRHASGYRVNPADQPAWTKQRQAWIDESRRGASDLWSVPLLAILMTLLAAGQNTPALPSRRARLLKDAVIESVGRWEARREVAPAGAWQPELRAEMLVDGFAEIAHELYSTGGAHPTVAREALARMLAARWGLAPAPAKANAQDILHFWDDQVGTFVRSEISGMLEPRSRVFAEIGEAMWICEQTAPIQHDRLTNLVKDNESREVVTLAAGLSQDISVLLIQLASSPTMPTSRILEWSHRAINEGAVVPAPALKAFVDTLIQACFSPPPNDEASKSDSPIKERLRSAAASRREREGSRWIYVRNLVSLQLPKELRTARDETLARLPLSERHLAVARGLSVLSDAAVDRTVAFGQQAVKHLRQMLGLAAEQQQSGDQDTSLSAMADRLRSEEPLSGLVRGAELSIPILNQLGTGAPEAIYAIAHHARASQYERIESQLSALGHTPPPHPDQQRFADMVQWEWTDPRDHWSALLDAMSSIAGTHGMASRYERWHMPALAKLFDALDYGNATMGDLLTALVQDGERLQGWVRAVANAYRIDLLELAQQASAILHSDVPTRKLMDVVTAPPSATLPDPDPHNLDENDIAQLIETCHANSDWLFDVAAPILLTTADTRVGDAVAGLLPRLPLSRRRKAAILMVAISRDPEHWASTLDDHTPASRIGIVEALTTFDSSAYPRVADALAVARTDRDMAIRLAAGADQETARLAAHWTCTRCESANPIAATNCSGCKRQTRPSM